MIILWILIYNSQQLPIQRSKFIFIRVTVTLRKKVILSTRDEVLVVISSYSLRSITRVWMPAAGRWTRQTCRRRTSRRFHWPRSDHNSSHCRKLLWVPMLLLQLLPYLQYFQHLLLRRSASIWNQKATSQSPRNKDKNFVVLVTLYFVMLNIIKK